MHHPVVRKIVVVRIISYFLARYNEKAAVALGCENTTQVFTKISDLLQVPFGTIKNTRDSFDPYLPTGERTRRGWHQRPLTPSMRVIQRHLEPLDFSACKAVVESLFTSGSPLHPVTITILEDLESAGLNNEPEDEQLHEPTAKPEVKIDLLAIYTAFQTALDKTGLQISETLCRSFLAALATKRFAILTGLSGSGKTQLAQKLGEWFGAGRSALIPVRPDWTGPEHLLGYEDALAKPDDDGRRPYQTPRVLQFILEAKAEPDHPYLLILDEMNLAHVERYFADILSGMESGDDVIPNVAEGKGGLYWPVKGQKPFIPLPPNLYIVGTVNVDETTYMFSPKVLDRANTFEFRVHSETLLLGMSRPAKCEPGPSALIKGFHTIAQNESFQLVHPAKNQDDFARNLRKLHDLLAASDWEFGYRVFYEANRFTALLEAAGAKELRDALDAQVMQKVLPRLHGNRRRLESTLCALGTFCLTLEYDMEADQIKRFNALDEARNKKEEPILPVSFDKVKRMLRNLRANQFASFTE